MIMDVLLVLTCERWDPSLNYQHMLIKQLCGERLLHHAVQRSILGSRPSIRIADIATGTA